MISEYYDLDFGTFGQRFYFYFPEFSVHLLKTPGASFFPFVFSPRSVFFYSSTDIYRPGENISGAIHFWFSFFLHFGAQHYSTAGNGRGEPWDFSFSFGFPALNG